LHFGGLIRLHGGGHSSDLVLMIAMDCLILVEVDNMRSGSCALLLGV